MIVGEDDGRSRVRFLLDAYPAGEPIALVIEGVDGGSETIALLSFDFC